MARRARTRWLAVSMPSAATWCWRCDCVSDCMTRYCCAAIEDKAFWAEELKEPAALVLAQANRMSGAHERRSPADHSIRASNFLCDLLQRSLFIVFCASFLRA